MQSPIRCVSLGNIFLSGDYYGCAYACMHTTKTLSHEHVRKNWGRLGSSSEAVEGSDDDECPNGDYYEGPKVMPDVYPKH